MVTLGSRLGWVLIEMICTLEVYMDYASEPCKCINIKWTINYVNKKYIFWKYDLFQVYILRSDSLFSNRIWLLSNSVIFISTVLCTTHLVFHTRTYTIFTLLYALCPMTGVRCMTVYKTTWNSIVDIVTYTEGIWVLLSSSLIGWSNIA